MNAYAEKREDALSDKNKKDKTGIPAAMKRGFEHSSGFSFDDVRVHYNSEKPAQLYAHAYTQGNDVYVAPGQEKHLPHELGHVVQQKRGAVRPTEELGGVPLNTDKALESGADRIAASVPVQMKTVQRAASDAEKWANVVNVGFNALNVIGGLYTLHENSKMQKEENKENRAEKRIGEIEKYSDATCEVAEEAKAVKFEFDNTNNHEKKVEKGAALTKARNKVKRNYTTTLNKAKSFGEDTAEDQGNFGNVNDENIKSALKRAYIADRTTNEGGIVRQVELPQQAQQNHASQTQTLSDAQTQTLPDAQIQQSTATQTQQPDAAQAQQPTAAQTQQPDAAQAQQPTATQTQPVEDAGVREA